MNSEVVAVNGENGTEGRSGWRRSCRCEWRSCRGVETVNGRVGDEARARNGEVGDIVEV
jgi:hypothetical protein